MGVIKAFSVSGLNPSIITTAGTSVVYFPDLPGSNLWNVGAQGVNVGVSSQFKGQQPTATNNAGGLQVPNHSVLDGQLFNVQVGGNYQFGAGEASATCKIGLYLSLVKPGNTSPAYQTIYEMTSTTAQDTAQATAFPFVLTANFQGDTASGVLQVNVGTSQIDGGLGGGTTGPKTAITGVNFAVDPNQTAGGMTFVVGVTFGTANAGNTASLKQFQISLF